MLNKKLIYDNGASQKYKGVHFARRRLLLHLRKYYRKHGSEGYILRFDFKDYFGSVPHDVVLKEIYRTSLDDKTKELSRLLISQNPGSIGLGIGAEISQVLGITYANSVDHLIKDRLSCKYYARYMDDGYILHNSKEELEGYLTTIKEEIDKIGGAFNARKTKITRLRVGFSFLQNRYSITETGKIYVKPNKKNITRQRKKLKKLKKKYEAGLLDMETIRQSMESWESTMARCDAYWTVKSMKKLYQELFEVKNDVSDNKRRRNNSN